MMQLATRPVRPGPPLATRAGAITLPAAPAELERLLARLAPISLAEMDAVALLNRTDTKYVLTTAQLTEALWAISGEYRVLEVAGVRLSPYQTVYFDTPDFALYRQHHAGKLNRAKVRSRRYEATGQAFLELKRKTNRARTVKRREPTATLATAPNPELAAFLAAYAPELAGSVEPRLSNSFARITLVSLGQRERLTIDLNLQFAAEGRQVRLPGIAVAEVKQDGASRDSAFVAQMHAAHLQPAGFSKYCIGVALLFPTVKHNNFKPKLRLLQQLMGEPSHD